MKVVRWIVFLWLVLLFSAGTAFADDRMGVTFLNPGARGDAFFEMMTEFMRAAAGDLDIDLEVVYCDRDHLKLGEEGRKVVNRENPPQYLVLINEKNGVADLLPQASARGIKVALINEGLQAPDRERLGGPGENLDNWVLEYLPDDRQAGFMLASALVDAARSAAKAPDGHVNMVAIAGNYQTGSSSLRVDGLTDAVLADKNVSLLQVAPGYWEEEHARKVTEGFLARYPETTAVWAASDLMARGARTAVGGALKVHDGIVIGGIDWAEFALHLVDEGKLTATVGGHFMDGGWTLVMLYDLHHGLRLPQTTDLSQFSLITRKNVGNYLKWFGKHDWNVIDFSRFSRKLNPQITTYRFGLEAVMEQLKE